MLEASFFFLVVVFPLIGAITRRWVVVVLPLVAWPLYYLGISRGWWLDGADEGWKSIAWTMTIVGVVMTATTIALARGLRPSKRQRSKATAR